MVAELREHYISVVVIEPHYHEMRNRLGNPWASSNGPNMRAGWAIPFY